MTGLIFLYFISLINRKTQEEKEERNWYLIAFLCQVWSMWTIRIWFWRIYAFTYEKGLKHTLSLAREDASIHSCFEFLSIRKSHWRCSSLSPMIIEDKYSGVGRKDIERARFNVIFVDSSSDTVIDLKHLRRWSMELSVQWTRISGQTVKYIQEQRNDISHVETIRSLDVLFNWCNAIFAYSFYIHRSIHLIFFCSLLPSLWYWTEKQKKGLSSCCYSMFS